jgi:homeobox protein cut-like
MKDVETYKDLLQKTETRLSKKVKDLTAETKKLVEEKDQLQKKMKNYDDYDEIKRELQIMKVTLKESESSPFLLSFHI